MGERQFGPYRLVRQIAVGGMAEIHLAKTKGIAGFEKYVALKMIHPNFAEDEQFIQMLVDEAKIAVQLAHGNIAQTFDLGRVGETYYITMEYVDGADLYKVLRRASERDLELPLDVCAFIGKEIASALDHAHRKRDHTGKPLGIVHRDVSPQNVLLSYAGEVKLVDFGIAKATMKARQTAVGVIKGKYYYMSPEQAWGDPIDARSDIFSAGIVLYEMITGQMLYLEEDLQKLLDMARRADIAPPSRLRKGVPPQLERIVMHALAKVPGDRYQSAGDFATDLERFLHAYSPVFTAGKIAALLREVVGDPVTVAPAVEDRGGPNATSTLDQSQVIQTRDEIRDENSVIFRVDELKPKGPPAGAARPAPKPASAPRVTRATDSPPVVKLTHRPPERPRMQAGKIPSLTKPGAKPAARPRNANEHTRQLDAPPLPDHGSLDDLSNVVTTHGAKQAAAWDQAETHDTNPGSTDLESVGERTMISAPGGHAFMMDAGEDSVDATVITGMPQHDPGTDVEGTIAPDDGSLDDATVASPGLGDDDETQDRDPDDDDGPTLSRDFVVPKPKPPPRRAPAPPALAAKIHAPAVSELRKPRQSRRTPPDGNPVVPNVLQQIVGAQANEPMPTPRPVLVQPPPQPSQSFPQQPPPQPSQSFPQQSPPFSPPAPAYSQPQGQPPMAYGETPHASMMPQHAPLPQQAPPYVQQSHGYLPQPPPYPYPPTYPNAQQPQQHVTPSSLYPFNPPHQQPLSLTGQLRLAEVDEMPSHYKLSANKHWLKYVIAGTLALGLAAGTTILVMSSSETARPTVGSVRIESVPLGADIIFDGNRLPQKTPYTITDVEIAKSHEVRIELPKHKPYVETLNLAPTGAESRVLALLKLNTGTLVVNSTPSGAEVRINDQIRGRTPTTIPEVDMGSVGRLELRLKDHQPYFQDLKWPESGELKIEAKLRR